MCHSNYYIKNYLFILLVILSSCNKDNLTEDTLVKEGISVPLQVGNIRFTGVSTRSTSPLSVGNIGIFRLASLGYVETRSNVLYTNSGGGWNVALGTEPIYVTKNNANLCAYSPYSSDESTFTDETLNLASQLYTSSADLCYQTGVTAISGTPVSFTMNHAYAKLKFNLTRSSDYSGACAISKISIANNGILSSNTLDISTGTYGSGTAGTVTVNPDISSITSGSTETVNILMVPVATLSNDVTITFTIDGEENSFTTAKLTSLKAGNDYTLNITIKSDVIVSEVTETANCYMIAPGNSLKIPVNVRGNGVSGEVSSTGISATISNPSSVGILWQTSPGLITLSDMTSDKKVTVTTNNSIAGNAVIAVYDGANQTGNILWSWHIWVTDYDPNPDIPLNGTTYPLINSVSASYVFMDRNLGATTVTQNTVSTLGLLYQWGRKDPFLGSAFLSDEGGLEPTIYNASGSTTMISKTAVSNDFNLDNTIKNPLTYYCGTSSSSYDWYSSSGTQNDDLWGGADKSAPTGKTMFDPSPAGWRVPTWKGSVSPWSKFSLSTITWEATDYGCTYNGDGSFYPAAGCRGNDNGDFRNVGSFGLYWSGSPIGNEGYYLFLTSRYVSSTRGINRSYGYSVRCVKE